MSILNDYLVKFEQALADTPTWQAWTGAADAAAAKEHIYWHVVPPEEQDLALQIDWGNDLDMDPRGWGTGVQVAGSLLLAVRANTPAAIAEGEAIHQFFDRVSQMMIELIDAATQDFPVQGIRTLERAARTPQALRKSHKDRLTIVIAVQIDERQA